MSWRDLFPVLNQIQQVSLDPNKNDRLLWKDGIDLDEFSCSGVWDSVRVREPEVDWMGLVWFSHCIPRHAFLMWLIFRRKLLTQDKILKWDFARRRNMNMMCCLLCYANVDSHTHLFFECKFSSDVWILVRDKVDMGDVDPKWNAIIDWLKRQMQSKLATDYVSRLLVAATSYFIWQERNARLLKNQTRPPDTIATAVLTTVRYKLLGMKFKDTDNVRRLLSKWEIHGGYAEDDGGR
ncbi:uncharacterized protein LOC110931770 [Helianthus annuus]|uniref:uncharacterized protein LOC110931770 n=1 Tax=Helianthus annuus TaxID=4232 RepID=UPI000B8FE014|nr:uncharacterized protein LOC110931770 [Helianthus annuus]